MNMIHNTKMIICRYYEVTERNRDMDDIKASFQKYDVDKSGSITLDEAYLVLQVKHFFLTWE